MVGVGLFSVMIALLAPPGWAAPAAGFSYFLIVPVQWIVAKRMYRLSPVGQSDTDGAVAEIPTVPPASPAPPIHTA